MSLFQFEGGAIPPTLYQLMRRMEDAFEGGNAGWDREHDVDGTHKPIAGLEVSNANATGTRGEALIRGPLETTGPHLVDASAGTDEGVYAVTLTATTNNLALPDGRAIRSRILRLGAAADRTLTGIVPYDEDKYQQLLLVNGSGSTITLSHNASGSSASYRLSLPRDSDFLLYSGRVLDLWYDPSSSVWRCEDIRSSMVRSIQRGTITITNGNSQNTATLATTLTDTSKCVVANLGVSGGSGGAQTATVGAYLDNLTTTSIRATRQGVADSTVVGYQVVEYY